jgi:hypothetical protein
MESLSQQCNTVASLKKICINAVAQIIQSPEELENFVQEKTKYHLLPNELRNKIASKLPARPRTCSYMPPIDTAE